MQAAVVPFGLHWVLKAITLMRFRALLLAVAFIVQWFDWSVLDGILQVRESRERADDEAVNVLV